MSNQEKFEIALDALKSQNVNESDDDSDSDTADSCSNCPGCLGNKAIIEDCIDLNAGQQMEIPFADGFCVLQIEIKETETFDFEENDVYRKFYFPNSYHGNSHSHYDTEYFEVVMTPNSWWITVIEDVCVDLSVFSYTKATTSTNDNKKEIKTLKDEIAKLKADIQDLREILDAPGMPGSLQGFYECQKVIARK